MAKRGDVGGGAPAPGWYADPHQRYDARYHDGLQWTAHVVRAGVQQVDPAAVTVASGAHVLSGGGGGYGSVAERGRLEVRNAAGAGLVIGLVGLCAVVASLGLPWVGGEALTDIRVYEATDTPSSPALSLATFAAWSFCAVMVTTLRYQPGPLIGFLLGGCIGVLVCRDRLDRDSTSIRSNVLFGLVVLSGVVIVWSTIVSISVGEGPQASAPLDEGPIVASLGFVIAAIGIFVGRRRRVVHPA